ncbi:indolepyruvate ferredoxin oxidoreductase subunit alpha [Streptomyces cucumeris]|uniref:indolepyruvate ferredoxin oxidoreductase subunit alpha n=1 Tax=Streptomyces cucumeris TaxID=2962890 RepID=UPI003D72925D
MPYAIGESCVDERDGSCVEVCPVDCIYEGHRKLYIHPGECIDCGACAEVCPNGAPVVVWRGSAPDPVAAEDAVFFARPLPGRDTALGSLGGASSGPPIGVDTEAVAAYEPPASDGSG